MGSILKYYSIIDCEHIYVVLHEYLKISLFLKLNSNTSSSSNFGMCNLPLESMSSKLVDNLPMKFSLWVGILNILHCESPIYKVKIG